MIESDRRKCVFLQTAIRELDLNAEVINDRIENAPEMGADVLSARALAPLKTLLFYAERHMKPEGVALFLKGASFRQEMAEALENWAFESEEYTSITDGAAALLRVREIKRV